MKLRVTLSEDVDCRLFRAENGHTYSLSARLRNYPNGSKVCLHGTVAEGTQCMTTPMIEVQTVRPWSSCPGARRWGRETWKLPCRSRQPGA